MIPLDPFTLDLQKTTLIEASAGTGKTYTITTLVVRLIAAGYPVESILVVTFTEAAAAELKLRIRMRLSRALAGLRAAGKENDDLVQFLAGMADPGLVCRRISLALTCFDQAAIMTIHSFCLQTLKEHAFETGSAFDMALLADQTGFLRQVSMDFFMARINDLDPLMLRLLAHKGITPETLARDMQPAVVRPGLCIIPAPSAFTRVCDRYRQIVVRIHACLAEDARGVADLIQAHTGLDKRSYSKKNVPVWLGAALEKCGTQGEDALFVMTEKGDSLYKFTPARMKEKTKAGADPPEHLFFDLCKELSDLYQIMETNVISLKCDFPQFYEQELARMKQHQGQCFFDDLVNDLACALNTFGKKQLISAVQKKYEACLIDEFQDTDPAQYRIFSTLFAKAPSRFGGTRPFFMIGDPKQAIYAFRGGDIFAYLAACRDSDQMFTLEKNFRSSPLLVQAVNDLFCAASCPFLFDDIGFTRVGTPDTAENRLQDNENNVAVPLQFSFVPRDDLDVDRQGYVTKQNAKFLIPKIVAGEILRDLTAGYTLLNKSGVPVPVTPGDMAVLVRTNQEAEDVHTALAQKNIAAFISKTGSVFDSPQAVALNDILWAVFRPDRISFMKAALATSVFGFSMAQLWTLSPEVLEQWQERFQEYKQIWEKKGFIAMIMALLHSPGGLLRADAGISEREVTNLYHLVELTAQAELHRHLSMFYLMRWYQGQLFADTRDEATDELRLESDRQAVTIVTIHKSKGLEYPIVYLPYLWSGTRPVSSRPVLFHDPDAGLQLCMDLRSTDYHGPDTAGMEKSRALHTLEEKAEQRRLLYVALTRASAMCRIFWCGISGIADSALGSMVHPKGCADDTDMAADLQALVADQKNICVQFLTSPGPDTPLWDEKKQLPELHARQLTRQIRPFYGITSFSALARGAAAQPGGTAVPDPNRASVIPDPGIDLSDLTAVTPDPRTDTPNLTIVTPDEGTDTPNPRGGTPAPKTDIAAPGEHIATRIPVADTAICLQIFPKGAGSGDFFHAVLEHMDFQGDAAHVAACVARYLPRFGLGDPALLAPATAAVTDIVSTQLVTGPEGFSLRNVARTDRLTEAEFLCDAHTLHLPGLADLLSIQKNRKAYAARLRGLDQGSVTGFVKGFIDLVVRVRGRYYIIDYKSNFLGDTYADYSLAAMTAAMEEHHYILQYHLYVMALYRYLTLRCKDYDHDRDFGGVLYLFIRGMHPDLPGSGVFFDRPPQALIQKMMNHDR